jgi:alpha-glucosidase
VTSPSEVTATSGTGERPGAPETGRKWWQDAVFYQIYPRSFCRAGRGAGEGAGDLAGITAHLDHLSWLGVDAIWLSPFYKSPMKDFGYDVSDYEDVDPVFGTLDDFDELLAAAHERGLRVIVDFVPNHTSDQHPWFLDARSSRDSAYRDFYIWRDPDPDDPSKPPNNWKQTFGDGPAWTFDEGTGQWYLHLFLAEQPDLDWSNPRLVESMEGVLAFWLDRGADGFRIDVVHALGKDPALPDVAEDMAAIPYSALNDDERTHPILRRLRKFVDRWEGDRVTVGEVFLLRASLVAKYYGEGDELHLAFNFTPMFCDFEATCFRKRVTEIERLLTPIGAWPTWVLSSHDRPRHRTRYGGSERRARAAAVLLLGMKGTPFLYAGEELGLEDAEIPVARVVDPGGRDGCRAPIPWDSSPGHGWALDGGDGKAAWLPFAESPGVEALRAEETSILHLYRQLLACRKAAPVLVAGEAELAEALPDLLAVRRHLDGEQAWVLVNFAATEAAWSPEGPWRVAACSAGPGAVNRVGAGYAGRLGPEEAVWLLSSPV